MDIVRHSGEADMAEHRAIFLCEPGHIKHGGRDALDMRRHSDQGCHRDDAGAADPGDHDVAMTWRKWRIGKLREKRIINPGALRFTRARKSTGWGESMSVRVGH